MLHAVFRRPVGEGPEQWPPDRAALPVRYRKIRNRLAGIVAQPGEACRKTPARLELPALGRAAIEGEDPALAGLGGVEGDLQAVTEETPCTSVVVCLRGREEVDESGIALNDRSYQRGKARVREGQAILEPDDQFLLCGNDALGWSDRQSLQERRITRDVGVVDRFVTRTDRCGRGYSLAPIEQSHGDMLHRFSLRP
jgi:hypothetical protein